MTLRDRVQKLERKHPAGAVIVLDEADRMLDMGFFEDIVTVARQCPKDRQTLLFSATYPEGIAKLASQFMREPQTVKVQAQHDAQKIKQIFYEVSNNERLHAVSQLLNHFRPESTLAFCNTKQQCRSLLEALHAQKIRARLVDSIDQICKIAAPSESEAVYFLNVDWLEL